MNYGVETIKRQTRAAYGCLVCAIHVFAVAPNVLFFFRHNSYLFFPSQFSRLLANKDGSRNVV